MSCLALLFRQLAVLKNETGNYPTAIIYRYYIMIRPQIFIMKFGHFLRGLNCSMVFMSYPSRVNTQMVHSNCLPYLVVWPYICWGHRGKSA